MIPKCQIILGKVGIMESYFGAFSFHLFHTPPWRMVIILMMIITMIIMVIDDYANQVLISCGPMDGCHGGDAGVANKWMADNGITVILIHHDYHFYHDHHDHDNNHTSGWLTTASR